MTKICKLTNIIQAVEIGTTLSKSWFRGHARLFEELTPGIFRSNYIHAAYDRLRPDIEFSIIEGFKRKAPALHSKLPHNDNHVDWLFLMQHYGSPTRLLDWTKSVLVGLYFAVEKHNSEDGELWALYPDELNGHNGLFGLPTPRCRILNYLAAEPNHNNPQKLVEEFGLEDIPKFPYAVDPPLHFPRMVSQMSGFTIHPRPSKGQTIPEIMTKKEHCVRYIIPKHKKRKILFDLASLGITRMTLFPDLDSLSHDIVKEHSTISYSPPEPPCLEGE